MTGRCVRTAFTLVELMVVATLLALAVGVATVNFHGMSDAARLSAAATQIGSLYRVASSSAKRSGLPRMLRFGSHECLLAQSVRQEGEWTWSEGAAIALVSRVGIVDVRSGTPDEKTTSDGPPWLVMLTPGGIQNDLVLFLALPSGARGRLQVDGYTGFEELRLLTEANR